MNIPMVKILNYSDSDFPSLESSNLCSGVRDAKTSTILVPRGSRVEPGSRKKHDDNSSSEKGRNLRQKVLKPYKHKESYIVNINDAITKTLNQFAAKSKPIGVKMSTESNDTLSGNPLDADNPVRRKGKFGVYKKPKQVSKTKKNVLKHREHVSKAKSLAVNVVVEKECVRHSLEVENEDVLNALYLAKLPEMRKSLKSFSRMQSDVSSEDKIERANVEEDKNIKDLLQIIGPNVIDIREAIKLSSVPPYVLLIHNHNFKRYCDNCITNELNEATTSLVSQIVRFQQNKYQKNPVKAVANKRFVIGFKQTIKYTRMNKSKMIICVPDMEDGMFDVVEELKSLASTYCVPYLFALTRRKLGFVTCKKVGVCCFGLLDSSSAEDNFDRVLHAAEEAKREYREKRSSAEEYCRLHLDVPTREIQNHSEEDTEDEVLTRSILEKLSLDADCTIGN